MPVFFVDNTFIGSLTFTYCPNEHIDNGRHCADEIWGRDPVGEPDGGQPSDHIDNGIKRGQVQDKRWWGLPFYEK